jgi:L-alanine-DL-glutamate epimerase-like enolase superfamily enzyme
VLAEPLVVKDSHVLIPATPGAGIRRDENAVKTYFA